MNITFVDVENTVTKHNFTKRNGDVEVVTDITPYAPNNKLVSVGINDNYLAINHKALSSRYVGSNYELIQIDLDATDLLVAHHMKHDLAWLWESGFTYDGPIWCTMVAEYIQARGRKTGLGLNAIATKRGVPNKLICRS